MKFSYLLPGPGYSGRHDFGPTEEEIAAVRSLFDGDLAVPLNFAMSVAPFDPSVETVRDMHRAPVPPGPQRNPQTEAFCSKLGVQGRGDSIDSGHFSGRYWGHFSGWFWGHFSGRHSIGNFPV